MKPLRLLALLAVSFAVGGGSAEIALRARDAVHVAKHQQEEAGAAGDLVALQLRGEDGELLAYPRLVTSPGKAAHLVLRDPANPARVRLSLRVEAVRDPAGFYLLDYALELPGVDVASIGRLDLAPGVERALDLGDVPLTATLVALPVGSAAYEAWLEGERERSPKFGAPRA